MGKRWVFAAALAVAAAVFTGGLAPQGLMKAEGGELASAFGGADCYDCIAAIGACSGTSCTLVSAGVYSSKVGSNMTPNRCLVVTPGNPGISVCASNTPQTCFTYKTCTDSACTNCGAASTDQKDTNCRLSGYRCD